MASIYRGDTMKKIRLYAMSTTNLLILLTLLMMLSYVHLSAKREKLPFFMTPNFIKVTNNSANNVPVRLLEKYNSEEDITIISAYDEEATIGIYDPNMNYAMGNTVIFFGQTRYFSSSDYLNATKSGIIVSDNLAYDMEHCKLSNNDHIEDVMYCTDSESMLSNDGKTRQIVNLFSFDNLGESVYLDYYSESGKGVVSQIVSDLKQNGYHVDSSDIPNVIEALIQPNKGLISVIMTGSFVFYILYYIVSYWYFFNMRREVLIHYLHGGQFKSMAHRFVKPLFYISILQLTVAYLFANYQRSFGYLIMSNGSLLIISIFHIVLTLSIHVIAYQRVYTSIKNKRGDTDYVR